MAEQLEARGRRPACRYSKALADAIIERLAAGGSWSRLAGTDVDGVGRLPARSVPYRWVKTHPEFGARWEEARLMAADWYAEEAAEVIKQGTPAQQASVYLALAARMAPHRWGAKAGAADGKPEGGPYTVVVQRFSDPPDPKLEDFE